MIIYGKELPFMGVYFDQGGLSPNEKQSNCLWEKYLFFSMVDNLVQSC